MKLIAYYKEVLSSETLVFKIIKDELIEIGKLMLKKMDYQMDQEALEIAVKIAYRKRFGANFANAREVRNILEKTAIIQALRTEDDFLNRTISVEDISTYAKEHNLGVVKELCGHGVGTKLHEDPEVPNFGTPNTGARLKEGMVIAIEPMLTLGSPRIFVHDDEWTVETEDGRPSAHFEHTVVVTADGYKILTGE